LIGQLSNRISGLKPTNQGTADLENQRNQAVNTLSSLIDIKTIEQSNGDLSIFTGSGLTLPIRGSSQFTVPAASTPPGSSYPGGGIPGITLGGIDVTSQMVGGQIGADITLRDKTLPTAQTALDQFSYTLTSRFATQGLDMFNDGGTPPSVPAANVATSMPNGYVGYASTIQVNAAVISTPSLVRDGTSSATPLNPGGLAGFTTLIQNITDGTFGNQPNGSLSNIATRLITAQAQQSANTTSTLTTDQALHTSLTARLSAYSGVNMDTEMSLMLSLQNAYGANARVINAAQSMFNQLEQAIQ
jgi:flagellar hook-associated protein 1